MMTNINCFNVCNGSELWNLDDLLKELKTIDDSAFSHHANNERNDFSNWVNDIKGNKVLAKQIKKSKSKEEMINFIEKKINNPSKKKKEILSQIREAILNG